MSHNCFTINHDTRHVRAKNHAFIHIDKVNFTFCLEKMIKSSILVVIIIVVATQSRCLIEANNVYSYSPCDKLKSESCPLHCKSPLERTNFVASRDSSRIGELIAGTINSSIVRALDLPSTITQSDDDNNNTNQNVSNYSSATQQTQQLAFESFCSGWKQRIATKPDGSPIAFWTVDSARQILLAKFIYYNSNEYFEIGSREALFVSPTFRHQTKKQTSKQQQHDNYTSRNCFLTFESSLTISSQLAINVIHLSEQTKARNYFSTLWTWLTSWLQRQNSQQQQQLNKQDEFANLAVIQRIQLENLVGMTVLGRDAISASGAWSQNKLQIPITRMLARNNNNNNNNPNDMKDNTGDTLLFALEFSAHMGRVTSDSSFLRGVAIANISLSAECLGISPSPSNDDDGLSDLDQEQLILMNWPTLNVPNGKLASGSSNERNSILMQFATEMNPIGALIVSAIVVLGLILLVIHMIVCLVSSVQHQQQQQTSQMFASPIMQLIALICCCWPVISRRRVYQANGDAIQLGEQATSKALSMIDLQVGAPELPPKEPFDLDMIDLHSYLYERTNCNSLTNDKGLKLLHSIRQIEKSNITIVQLLGQGAFGNVYSALLREDEESGAINENNKCHNDTFYIHTNSNNGSANNHNANARRKTRQVAVKMLSENLSHKAERLKEFVDEAINLARASHRNIVQLIGVSFQAKPFYIIMELMMGGSLGKFLIRNGRPKRLSNAGNQSLPSSPTVLNETIRMGDLLVFALDIARACNYLSRQGFIHRDLAIRNCLLTLASNDIISSLLELQQVPPVAIVDTTNNDADKQTTTSIDLDGVDLESVYTNGYNESGRVVKLADFGLTREIQSESDYYLMTMDKKVPVRWMAPECSNYKATIKSEVWSFGVVMWEIFSLGRLPYEDIKESDMVFQFLRSLLPRDDFNSKRKEQQNTSSVDSNYLAPEDCEVSHGLAHEYYVSQYDHEPPLPYPQPNTPDSIYSIMCYCWALEPDKRPDFDKLVKLIYKCLRSNEVVQSPIKEVAQI